MQKGWFNQIETSLRRNNTAHHIPNTAKGISDERHKCNGPGKDILIPFTNLGASMVRRNGTSKVFKAEEYHTKIHFST